MRAEEKPLAPDTAELNLLAPKGTTVGINGNDYGQRLEFELPGMEPGHIYRYQVELTPPGAAPTTHTVLLRGGWRVELPAQGPAGPKPELVPQTGHALSVWGATFSPDARYVLTGGMDMAAVVWDAHAGRQLRILRGHKGPITSVAFSPDGAQALTASFDGTAVIWDPRKGAVLRELRKPAPGPVWSAAFTPDGKYVLTDRFVWDAAGGQQVLELSSGKHDVRAVSLSRDGRLAATGSHAPDSTVVVWDAQTGQPLRTLSGHKDNVNSVALSPDGRLVASGSDDQQVVVWDARTGAPLHKLNGHADQVKSVAFSPDGRYLASGALDQKAILWDAQSGRALHTWQPTGLFPGQSKVWALTFSPDGRQLLAAFGHNEAVIWDVETRQPALALRGATTIVGAAAFSPDGRHARMVAGLWGLDWDADTGRPVGNGVPLDRIPASPITSVAFDKNARHILVSLADKTDHLYDVQAGRELQVFRDHGGGLFQVACSPDGRWALTGSNGPAAFFWDLANGRRQELAGHAAQAYAVAMSADGRYAVTGGFDNAAIVWDVASQRQLQVLRGAAGVVTVAVSPDGKRVFTGTWDNAGAVWDVGSGEKLFGLGGHENWIWAAAFSPDQRCLATGGWDNKINLWDAATGDLMRSFDGHSGWVTSVQLSPDNRYLLSGSFDGTARLWDVATGADLAALIGLNHAKDWLVITPDGLFDGSRAGREMVSFRFGGDLNVVPVDRFFQDFYRPGLLNEVWRGERPMPEIRLGAGQPPAVRILAPKAGGRTAEKRVTIEVEVADRGSGVLGPWLLQNDVRVLAPGKTEKSGTAVRREFDVALVDGENRFQVCAASADGSWESEPALLSLSYAGPIAKPRLHVLAVSINRYAAEPLSLEFPARDAAAMAGLLRHRHSALYSDVRVTGLRDQQATRPGILRAIRDVGRTTEAQDTLLVYLAGNGLVAGNQYCFLPYEYEAAGAIGADPVSRGLAAADVGEALASAAALKRLLVFDTGQSGRQLRPSRTARNPFALRGAIERLSRTQGAFTIAAAASSDQAREVPELEHGVLTYALLAGARAVDGGPLARQGIEPRGGDRAVDVLEWFAFASAQVPALTERYFGRQEEVQHASAGASFALLSLPATGETPAPRPHQAIAPPPRPAAQQPAAGRPAPSSATGAAAHVVAVGVNRYRQASMNLRYAADDARAMSDVFRQRGGALYGDVPVHLLLDDQATRAGILDTIQKVAKVAQPDDLAVLFLAGHGAMVGQRYYFIPHDFTASAATLDQDIRRQGIPADELADALADVRAQKQLLILDTCASGSIVELGRAMRDPTGFRTFIERLGRRQGIFTIAAAAAGADAQEIPQLGHGVLTYALLAALRAAPPGPLSDKALRPANAQGLADVLDLFSFASGYVPRLTQLYLGTEQDVQTSGQGRSFPVLPASPD